jgi:HCO3- transporter family
MRILLLLFVTISKWGLMEAFSPIPQYRVRLSTLGPKMSLTMSSSTSLKLVEPFGKGLMEDVKRKSPHYKTDFTDGLTLKSMSSIVFLFFACLAPAVAFGGLLGLATNGQMGTMETVGATAIGGVIYALFSAQPLTIIGTTGPLLAFLKVLYDACSANGIAFLPVYSWVGLWSSLFLFLSSFFSLSNVVEYFTKFTDDIFSTLISVIFIMEALKDLVGKFSSPEVSGMQAFVTLSVALTTFLTAKTLSGLRRSPFLVRKLREVVSDFAPTIGVMAGVSAAAVATKRYSISLPMLSVPAILSTTSGRPWLVDIFAVSNKIKLLCIFPALMATVLLFMDQNITVRLIMSKENKLKKGSGLHLDMFVVAIVTAVTSLLGMPWMVAATVRSLAHMRSLKQYTTVDSTIDGLKNSAAAALVGVEPSVSVPATVEMTGVQEQRLTGLMIHSLIGFSIIYLRPFLKKIPNAVLTGLFLFLGVSSITTTDLFDRFKLFFIDNRDKPSGFSWSKGIETGRVKLFTTIQLALLASMWWIKGTKLGVFFPVLIGALAPVRIALEKLNIFTKKELDLLDGEIE